MSKDNIELTQAEELITGMSLSEQETNQLEKSRKKYCYVFFGIEPIILAGGYITLSGSDVSNLSDISQILLVLLAISAFILPVSLQRFYRGKYNTILVEPALKKLGATIDSVNATQIIRKKLPGIPPGDVKSSNEFFLKTDHWQACVANINITQTRGSGKRRRKVTVFRGALIETSIPDCDIKETIVINRDVGVGQSLKKGLNLLGGLADKIFEKATVGANIASNLEEIQLLSPEFNKVFSVKGGDQVGVRKILKPAFIEKFTIASETNQLEALTIDKNTFTAMYEKKSWQVKIAPNFFLKKPKSNTERYQNIANKIKEVHDSVNELRGIVEQ